MEIKKNLRNELMKRHELTAELESEKNPGFEETKKMLAEKFSKPEEAIEVYGVKGSFGKKCFIIKANIYDSEKDLETMIILSKTQKQRKAEAEEKKKAEEEKKKAREEAGKKAEEEKKTNASAENPEA